MLQRSLLRACMLACGLLTTVTGISAVPAVPAAAATAAAILSPADGSSVPARFTGPYTVDMTGAPIGTWRGILNCEVPDDADPFAVELGNFTWDGTTDPVHSFTATEIPTTATRCSWNIKPANTRDYWNYDAWSQFTVTPAPDPKVIAPQADAVLPNGYTGPFTVDMTDALPGSYISQVSCYSTRWDYSAELPAITWDGSTDPVRTYRLEKPMPTAPDCYWGVFRSTEDDYPYEVYGKVFFSVDAPPVKIAVTGQSPATFYPLVRDSYRDTTTTTFTLSRPASVTTAVVNSSGRVVASRTRNRAAGTHTWTWDGRRGDGSKLPAGSYRIRVRGKDSNGDVAVATAEVTSATKIVTRTDSRTVAGSTGSRSATSGCSAVRWEGRMGLDCFGGRYARARYTFKVPTSTYATSLSVRGHAPAADICCDGRITKTATRPTKTTYAVVAKVTGWRAYTVRSVTATWKYRKRI